MARLFFSFLFLLFERTDRGRPLALSSFLGHISLRDERRYLKIQIK